MVWCPRVLYYCVVQGGNEGLTLWLSTGLVLCCAGGNEAGRFVRRGIRLEQEGHPRPGQLPYIYRVPRKRNIINVLN